MDWEEYINRPDVIARREERRRQAIINARGIAAAFFDQLNPLDTEGIFDETPTES